MRLRCRLFGCRPGPDKGRFRQPHEIRCVRCGATRDRFDFFRGDLVGGVAAIFARFVAWLWPRCEHCGRRLRRRRPAHGWAKFFCSEKCCEGSLPF